MDFSQITIGFISSLIIVLRRLINLVFFPYKTMRKISSDADLSQAAILLLCVFLYFLLSSRLRSLYHSPLIIFSVFLINFLATTFFFYLGAKIINREGNWSSFIMTFTYSLWPTLIWFITNSGLYYVLPPPRTLSVWGKSFSIVFIAFSISLLCWKIILVYLAIRFSGKLNFYRTVYLILLYLCWFIPYSILLYHLKLFRIPLI